MQVAPKGEIFPCSLLPRRVDVDVDVDGGREMATTTLRREVKGTLVPARIKTRFSFSALNGMVVAVIAPQQ